MSQEARIGREEADGLVAPVVEQALFLQESLVQMGHHRHQLHRGHTQRVQMVQHRRRAQAKEAAAALAVHAGMLRGHALYMRLIMHRDRPAMPRRAVLAPGKAGIGDDALGHRKGAVAGIEGQIGAGRFRHVAQQRLGVAELAGQAPCIRVDQQLVGIEAKPFIRGIAAVGAKPVLRARCQPGDIDVPHVAVPLAQRNARQLLAAIVREQAQLHQGRIGREHGEVHALAIPGRAHRVRAPCRQPVMGQLGGDGPGLGRAGLGLHVQRAMSS
ncbi:hypothetical protein FALB51S_00842 [Frigidibacter albus]